jgi:transposase-like protein
MTGRRSDGLTTAESVEVAKLRKRIRELEIERDILKKAAAWFAHAKIKPRAWDANSETLAKGLLLQGFQTSPDVGLEPTTR